MSAQWVPFSTQSLIVEFVRQANFSRKILKLVETATMSSALTVLPHQLPVLSAPMDTVSFKELVSAAVAMLEQTTRCVSLVDQDNTLTEERAWVVRTPNAKTAHSQLPEFVRHATQHSRRQDRTALATATSS